jgi:hypothetical protein
LGRNSLNCCPKPKFLSHYRLFLAAFACPNLNNLFALIITTLGADGVGQPQIATIGTFYELGRGQKVVCAFPALFALAPFLLG